MLLLFSYFCACQEVRPSVTEEDIQRRSKNRELNALGPLHIQEKSSNVIEM